MKKLFIFAVLSLLMIGCTDDEPISVPNAMEQSAKENEHRVSLQDALKRAESLLSQIGDPATRSKTRKVKSVEYLQNQLTRSGAIDTTLYLVNYEDNAGFALLGADDRVRPIYAISDEGRLNMEDTVENKGLALFFRNTEAEIANSPLVPEIDDSLIYIGPPIIDPPYHEVVVYRQVEPLLGSHQRLWHQEYPYNIYCPQVNGSHASVGCTAMTLGQIMSYFQWPTNIGSETFPWQAMNAGYANERVAKLFQIIGDVANMNYSSGIGMMNYGRMIETIRNLGYYCPSEMPYFNESAIQNILNKAKRAESGGSPIIIGADSSTDMDEHVWIIDGYIQYKTISNQIVGGEQLHDVLYHCVWGWSGGLSNGYFYWARTNSFSGNPIEKDNEFQMNLPNLNYDIEVRYLGGFIPDY